MTTGQVMTTSPAARAEFLQRRYAEVREFSRTIAAPLSAEDCAIQSMPDVSPIRWHLAHTTWFFETFLLKPRGDYQEFDERFEYLFNSYYNSVGQQFPRHQRGLISRPGLAETLEYRQYVDRQLELLLAAKELTVAQLDVLELGLNHEQQHQELMLTDIKHVLFGNPLYPAYQELSHRRSSPACASDMAWHEFDGAIATIGYDGQSFAFDNEGPVHETYIQPHRIALRCVTNGEFIKFIAAGGYKQPQLWLSLGWDCLRTQQWTAPLYWVKHDSGWLHFTLGGLRELDMDEPVSHVSYFEADAYARWAGLRLPTEFEWEVHASRSTTTEPAVFADRLLAAGDAIHPQVEPHSPHGMLGNLWEWTSSQYTPYPRYRPANGALGEYNGKFMCNQFVLRGGSCATVSEHIRPTYRNFFPPDARWQFSGIRLADDLPT